MSLRHRGQTRGAWRLRIALCALRCPFVCHYADCLWVSGDLPCCDGVQTQLCSSSKITALPILRVAVLSHVFSSSLLSFMACCFYHLCFRLLYFRHPHAVLSLSCAILVLPSSTHTRLSPRLYHITRNIRTTSLPRSLSSFFSDLLVSLFIP